jgi:hypothetical protein
VESLLKIKIFIIKFLLNYLEDFTKGTNYTFSDNVFEISKVYSIRSNMYTTNCPAVVRWSGEPALSLVYEGVVNLQVSDM